MDSKIVNITVFQMCKTLSRDMEDVKKNQIELIEMKIIISEMKKTLDEITSKLDFAEEKTSELEGMSKETIPNETQRKKIKNKRYCQ